MRAFADLYRELDSATATRHKIEALKAYLAPIVTDPPRWDEAAWAIYLLSGGKPRQMIPTRILRRLATEATGLPEWLVEESYQNVGDLAETLSLLLPPARTREDVALETWMNERLPALRKLDDDARYARLAAYADALDDADRFVFFKLTTGSLRVGVAKGQVVQALAEATGLDRATMAQRLMGYTQAGRTVGAPDFAALVASPDTEAAPDDLRPYPFFLAHPLGLTLEELPEKLGPPQDWIAEWKFDGIRGQLIRRGGVWRLWSRGEELICETFPDMATIAAALPDGCTLDGEIVVAQAGVEVEGVEAFAKLQQRLNRKSLTDKHLSELPVAFIAYDLLAENGEDLRARPQHERRERLTRLVRAAQAHAPALRLSPRVEAPDWPGLMAQRLRARDIGAEGLMLKGRDAPYGAGRRRSGPGERDLWFKWKVDPMAVDAVLIYAQKGHGRRSGVYSDYTFAVWSGPQGEARALVPFAKAYSGLTDEEMREVDAVIRRTTIESFGPVRSVRPTLVFELGFEGLAPSRRHKSGVATRFPRMLRWRRDKPVEEADTLGDLRALLP